MILCEGSCFPGVSLSLNAMAVSSAITCVYDHVCMCDFFHFGQGFCGPKPNPVMHALKLERPIL